jgi:glucose/arabinose dehydrogenase
LWLLKRALKKYAVVGAQHGASLREKRPYQSVMELTKSECQTVGLSPLSEREFSLKCVTSKITKHTLLFLALFMAALPAFAQEDVPGLETPCFWRETDLSQPWIGPDIPCLEEVIHDPSLGELAFTALAVSPDNTLYAARPLAGQVLALDDSNDDYLPDTPHVVAEGLTLPNGLAYQDDTLYIAGGTHIYRLRNGALETLVHDLPTGGGFWTGGVAVGEDERLYVATGAPCDFCSYDGEGRGAVLSFNLDGGDRQIVATGLHQPADLTFHNGDLYVLDSARDGLFDTPDLDEINRVQPGAFFGFPFCVGVDNAPDIPGFDCADAVSPIAALPTASTPLGIASYASETIPALRGKLLVTLGGSYNEIELRGYALAALTPEDGTWRVIMPADNNNVYTVEQMNYRGSGLWPHRPLDVTVNAWGWIYISVGGGRILAFRPQSPNP